MLRLFRSWRAIRWVAFLLSFALDAYIFYMSDPFTPRSFLASGLAALLFFLLFFEIAIHMKGRRRVRSALDDNEVITYQVGRHLFALLRTVRENRFAWYAIWLPIQIAFLTTLGIFWIFWQEFSHAADTASWVATAQYACAGYLPLLFAIPFVLEHVSEWASNQFVIVQDTKSHEPRLLIHKGVLDYDLETVSIERTVTTHVHQAWWESLVGIGDVELRETAGGSGEKLTNLWRPRRFKKNSRCNQRSAKKCRRRRQLG